MSRGSIDTRGKGKDRHRIRIYLGKGADGKKRYYTETVHGQKKQAERRLTELLRELDTGGFVERTHMTLGEFLEYWLNTAVVPHQKPKTISTARSAIKRITPKLGHIPLQQVRPVDLQEYYAWALREGKGKDDAGNGIGYAHSTVNQDHRTLHKALEDGVAWGLLGRNVAGAVPVKPKQEHRTSEVWMAEEARRFLETASRHRLYACFALALTAGLRLGELVGLRRDSLRLDDLEIDITQTIVEVDGKIVIQETPKTAASAAPVPISEAVADILRSHLVEQAKTRLAMGSRYRDQGLVFCTVEGDPLWPSNVRRTFHYLCKKAGVPKIRMHDTRHTYITKLLNDRVPPQVVQRLARHTTFHTTVQLYGHAMKHVERSAVKHADEFLPDRSTIIDEDARELDVQRVSKKTRGAVIYSPSSWCGVLDSNQ